MARKRMLRKASESGQALYANDRLKDANLRHWEESISVARIDELANADSNRSVKWKRSRTTSSLGKRSRLDERSRNRLFVGCLRESRLRRDGALGHASIRDLVRRTNAWDRIVYVVDEERDRLRSTRCRCRP